MPERVTDGVWRVDLGNVNAYLLETEAGPVAVDAGMPGDVEDLREAIGEVGYAPEDLQAVLVTHTDLDHVGGLAALVEDNGATVHLSPVAAKLITGERSPPWLSTKGLLQRIASPWLESPPADRLHILQDGDRVHGLRVVETPGHALGHLSFVDEGRGVCFIGDLIRAEGRLGFPSGLINYDSDQLRASLEHLLDAAPGIDVVCAGHGDPVLEDAHGALEALLG